MKAPKAVPGTTEMVSVEWLLKNLASSVDRCNNEKGEFDFFELFRKKVNDGCMGPLWLSVMEKGWTVPICLYRAKKRDLEDGKYGPVKKDDRWSLGNGHHRMTLAILMFAPEIKVYWDKDGDYMNTYITDKGALPWGEEYHGIIPGFNELLREKRTYLKPKPSIYYDGKFLGNLS